MPHLLLSCEGRIGVRQYWLGLLSGIASSLALAVVVGLVVGTALILTGAGQQTQQVVSFGGALLVGLFTVYTQVAVALKRCRAVGRSGWWCLVILIPLVGPLWLLLDLGINRSVETGAIGV